MTIPPSDPNRSTEDDAAFGRRLRSDARNDVERLVAANAASNATMSKLVEKVRDDAEKRERKIELLENESRQIRRVLLLVGAACVLLLALAAFNAMNISQARKNAVQTAEAAKNAASTNTLLLSCFDATSECAKLNEQAQARQNNDLKAYYLTVGYCQAVSHNSSDGDAFLDCMKQRQPAGPGLPKQQETP